MEGRIITVVEPSECWTSIRKSHGGKPKRSSLTMVTWEDKRSKERMEFIYFWLLNQQTSVKYRCLHVYIVLLLFIYIHTYFFFWTSIVENSFTMKLGNFTAAHAQTRVAVKNKWEVAKNKTKTVNMNGVIWNNSGRFRHIFSTACDTCFSRPWDAKNRFEIEATLLSVYHVRSAGSMRARAYWKVS